MYGTADEPSEEELERRQAQAVKAATWSVYRGPFWGRVKAFPRVLADSEVRDSDLESANLVLFGTEETNSIIAQFSDRLPLHLDAAAESYGLVYVYPVEGRYVLVNSGLPWWQAEAGGMDSPFTGDVVAFELNGLKDYLLFEGSADDVVAEGRFDTDWHLPADDAEIMQASRVVRVTKSAANGSR